MTCWRLILLGRRGLRLRGLLDLVGAPTPKEVPEMVYTLPIRIYYEDTDL